MSSKKRKGSKVTVERSAGAVQPGQPDMSKYANAYSNKSKINYAELKLVRSDKAKTEEKSESSKKTKEPEKEKQKQENQKQDKSSKNTKANKENKKKAADSRSAKEIKKAKKARSDRQAVQPASDGLTAEERYSNALGKEDHYSSAVEKYYLKYPDAKRPKKSVASRRSADLPKKKRRSSGGAVTGQSKRSMAEIAVKNKGTSSVKEYARAARNAKARGVVSPTVANRSFYRRKKKRSGALNVLMVTLLLVFLTAVGVKVFLNVRQVTVTGNNPYSEAKIKEICNIKIGSNILFVNTDELEKKVEQQLPYIAECSIKRRLPSTVIINVKGAEVLGVAQTVAGKWSVISTKGKILESDDSQSKASEDNATQSLNFASADELAASRKLPVLTGLAVKSNVKDGFITDEAVLNHIGHFVYIKKAFGKVKMNLTSISYGNQGYVAEYDKRITIRFGREIDEKTVYNRMQEVHALIFDKGYVNESDSGEIRFNKSSVYFRPSFEVSEEEIQRIKEQRRETNREQLVEMAEMFMTAGKDWLNGSLVTE